MPLRTLGGLTLLGARLKRPKPLLLLGYLALEGPRDRRHAAALLARLDAAELAEAVGAYAGAFVDGVHAAGMGAELEEWIYASRAFLAEQVREAHALAAGRSGGGRRRFRRRRQTGGAGPTPAGSG